MTITSATHAISVNPVNGERLTAMPWASRDEIAHALDLAASGFNEWKHTTVAHRAQMLRKVGHALRQRAEEMAQCISREMGKPIKQARAEVAKSAALCDWYAEHGPLMLNPEPTQVENNPGGDRISSSGHYSGRYAVELPAVAGHARCSAYFTGREWLPVKARTECNRVCRYYCAGVC